MPAKFDGERIIAQYNGRYGFGGFAAGLPLHTRQEAWRMVQRAKLTRHADKATARIVMEDMGTVAYVTYDLLPDAGPFTIPNKHRTD